MCIRVYPARDLRLLRRSSKGHILLSPTTRPRLAVATIFLVNGTLIATWASRIPDIKNTVGLNQAGLGITLLGAAIGSLLAMNVAGVLASHYGSRKITMAATFGVLVALPLLALTPNPVALFLALLLYGATNGSMDVAMNAQAVGVERIAGRPLLSSLHGMYSAGGLLGSLAGAIAAASGFDPIAHFTTAAVISLCVAVPAFAWLLPSDVDARGAGMAFSFPRRAVLVVGLIAFCTVVGEGAATDWSAVYLRSNAGASAGVATFGFGAFSLTMAISRFTGDALNTRFGPMALVRAGGLLAASGFAIAILFPIPVVAILGFGLAGLGFSSIFPLAISAAGRMENSTSSTIAAVATCGYTGFLAGPPIIGFVAQATSLRVGLSVVVCLSALAALLAPAVGRTPRTLSETPPVAAALEM